MSENLKIYNLVREVPPTALKKIEGGRLKNKSDINPMWRIKTLTEQFGMCGIGWKYVIVDERLETGGKDEIAAFVQIKLYVKVDGKWSEAIPGTGGSSFVTNEKAGPYVNDECFKMALTDAISVACKAIGVGANVYWDSDKTKYDKAPALKSQNDKSDDKSKVTDELSGLIAEIDVLTKTLIETPKKEAALDAIKLHNLKDGKGAVNYNIIKDITVANAVLAELKKVEGKII